MPQDWDETGQRYTSLTTVKDVNVGQHLVGTGAVAPTAAAGTNSGTSPPAPVVASTANDVRGHITFGSGSSSGLAAGIQVAVTFAGPFGATPVVMVVAKNDATEALGLSVTTTATGFNLVTHGAPSASQANTVYSFDYLVIG